MRLCTFVPSAFRVRVTVRVRVRVRVGVRFRDRKQAGGGKGANEPGKGKRHKARAKITSIHLDHHQCFLGAKPVHRAAREDHDALLR